MDLLPAFAKYATSIASEMKRRVPRSAALSVAFLRQTAGMQWSSKQEMLRSVAKQGPSLVITYVQPFPWNRLIVDGIAETASVGGLIASSATHQLRQLCPPRCAGLPRYISSLLLAALAARVHTTC
jgi:hypothetical protein